MLLKRLFCFTLLIFLNLLLVTICSAAKSVNPFQGTWISNNGGIIISNCHDMKCKIEISSANGAHTCDVNAELTVRSAGEAFFQVEKIIPPYITEISAPIKLTLSKQVITLNRSESDNEDAPDYCTIKGFFEDTYTNSKTTRPRADLNCNKTKTSIEAAVCHSSNLALADKVLEKLYFQIKAKQLDSIVNAQNEWINNRNLCSGSANLNKCLADKYRDRILSLQHEVMSSYKSEKPKGVASYNYDYLLYLARLPTKSPHDIFQDPPLQNYLKTALPKEIVEKILPTSFYEIKFGHVDESSMLIQGGAPGLYNAYEGALLLTKEHQSWLAYININDNFKKQIIILGPRNANTQTIPAPLKQWVNQLLPYMSDKKLVYKKIFS